MTLWHHRTRPICLPARCSAWLVAGMAFAAPLAASAEVTGAAVGTLRYDNNVFALPADDQPLGVNRSDVSYSGTFDLDAAFHPAGYSLDLEANVAYEGFARNSGYNNLGYALALTANPDYTQKLALAGTLGARQSLSNFAALGLPVRNLQTLVTLEPVASLRTAGELVVVAAPVYDRSTNTASLFTAYNYERYGVSAGIGWHTPLNNRIDLTFGERWTRGLDARLVGTGTTVINAPIGLRDDRVDLAINYQITPVTSVSATATYIWRHDSTPLGHDFSAPFGDVGFRFHPAPGTRLIANIGWRLETLDQIFVDSVRTQYADVTGSVHLADRWRVYGKFNYYRRRFEADRLAIVNGYSLNAVDRIEHSYHYEIGASYALNTHLAANVNLAHEIRNSRYYYSNYHENIAQLALIYVFGAHPEREFNLITGQTD